MAELLRADAALVQAGLAKSRERAKALIEAGLAFADGTVITKPAQKLDESARLEVRGEVCPYVSRGGFKLEKALKSFGVDPSGLVCADIGASTGGFTDVLLRSGARLVYAVDVGTSQLDDSLRSDSRVVCMEQTNARTLTRADFDPAPSLGVMDVSFISILKLLDALRDVLGSDGRLITLIKPQFEAGRKALGKHGIVTDPAVHERVLRELCLGAAEHGWQVLKLDYSPIRGGDGNLEFLAELVPCADVPCVIDPGELRALVKRAKAALKEEKA